MRISVVTMSLFEFREFTIVLNAISIGIEREKWPVGGKGRRRTRPADFLMAFVGRRISYENHLIEEEMESLHYFHIVLDRIRSRRDFKENSPAWKGEGIPRIPASWNSRNSLEGLLEAFATNSDMRSGQRNRFCSRRLTWVEEFDGEAAKWNESEANFETIFFRIYKK